ncbi:extended synaptotagmin-3-like isoform X2 [Cyprinus carpio]|uniref:Extended synaptotagmin-3 n=1 Tax=Cyprinus carpio TaxID=7962 RepID=A0A9Q9YG18_CYPCA|nr:extended synaptotagmin-3-like isoform X1 [Cyprinus carpio]XP_042619560.1 extended synaptotagmin-3-like isoform X1 [Cyprinus carpio]XP_042619561.1 extended synaptotagmin-3-like isoform X2 [Cyprinus carpio]
MSAAVSGGQEPSISTGDPGLSVKDVNQLIMEFLMFMMRAIVLCYPVYLTGSLGLSISWILLSMLVWTMWKNNRRGKDQRIDTAIDFLENEKDVISTELRAMNMPAWIHFTDVEKAAWINKILQQAWPFFGMYMEKLLIENIQPSVRSSSPHLKTFTFTKVHMGQKAPTITGIRVYTHELETREVILDLNIIYEADVDIDADVKPAIKVGVKGLQLQGMLRVILEPLIGQAPLVGGVTMFFIRRPALQVNWTGMTNVLDGPGLSHLSESAIVDVIASLMVLPNRMCFPLIDQVKVDQMKFPLPRGIVRVHVLEARDLVAKDTFMMGLVKGKSDPYTVLRVGNKQFKTKTIKETLNPRWNEVYEFVIHEAPGQELELELYDEDTDADDFLGRYSLDCGDVRKDREIDEWFTLEDIETGQIHMKLQWFSLHTNPALLQETSDGLACAMLAVYLDSASNLPKDHREFTHNEKHGKPSKEARLTRRTNDPNSYVEFSIDQQSQKSKVVFASKDPTYDECFTFFVHSVNNQVLNVEVKEHEKKSSLGKLTLPLVRLLNVSDMTMDQRFLLERSVANSQIKMKAVLRILTLEKQEAKVVTPPDRPEPPTPVPAQPVQSVPKEKVPVSSVPLSRTQTVPAPMPSSVSSYNELQAEYTPYRRSTFVGTEQLRSSPSTPSHMRRFDSHSLLSENSIDSSRFDLTDNASYPEAILNHQGSFGRIQLTLRYATLRKRLIVIVSGCKDLFSCSESGSDTYVRMYLLPDQTWKHRKRTSVKKKTVNPVFNETFEFAVSMEEARTRKLDVAVKNNKMLYKRERKEIGMVWIDMSQMDLIKGSTEWYELTLPGLKKTN